MTDSVKRFICEFNKPSNISKRVTYYLKFLLLMLDNPLFTSIATLIASAQTQVGKLNTAEIAAAGKIPGSAALRDAEELKTEIIMEKVLAKVQDAGDDDFASAKALFETLLLKIRERSTTEHGEFEANQGKVSKTIDVKHIVIKGSISYLTMISVDKEKWFVGSHGTTSGNTVDNCNDLPLVVGTLYYLKSQTCKNRVYSDWSQVVEVTCI